MRYSFFVHGKVTGKARPRKGRNGFYTPPKTVEYETKVKTTFLLNYPDYQTLEGPVYLDVKAQFPIVDKKKDLPNKMCTKKPDCDNILKIICDALNELAFTDDKNIVGITCYKFFTDGEEGVLVEISGDL